MRTLSTADAVLATLAANGIDQMFCVPGVQNDPFFDAWFGVTDRIRPVHTRHEQGAGYMALGAAMATGRPAAYCVVPGPGFLNSSAALSTAYAVNAPVLALVGQIPQAIIGRGLGVLHELPDQLAMLRLLTKWAARIDRPTDAPRLTTTAFHELLNGRPRPVALECPMDVWARRGEVALQPAAVREPLPVDEDGVEAAARLLGRAERPLIVVGGGAVDARDEVRVVAELLQAAVVGHRLGLGVLDARHPLAVTIPIGYRLWRDADVVLAVGTRLQLQQMEWGVDDALKVVRIDVDPYELNRFRPATVGIVGDAARTLARLAERLPAHNRTRGDGAAALAPIKAEVAAELEKLQPQVAYLRAIRAALPENGILVEELTQIGYVARLAFPVYRPRTFLSPGYQGTLGWGVATALGAKAACPDAAVVSISGDGGFLFTASELATAVVHRLATVNVVFNDNAFGNVRRFQRDRYNNHVIATELANPDFLRLAESFGIAGERAESPDALRAAIVRALERGGPALIEVPVNDMPSPWHLLHMKKNRPASKIGD